MTAAAALLAGTGALYFYFNKPEADAATQWTDDAYVQADYTNVPSRVSGTIESVLVDDNEKITKGQPIAVLDDRDYKVAEEHASAAVVAARASVDTTVALIARQASVIAEANATISADNASLELARSNAARTRQLTSSGSATIQALEEAQAELAKAVALKQSHQSSLQAANGQLNVLKAELSGAQAALAQANATLDDANLKLSYTKIYAPISGIVGMKTLRTGGYVTSGSPLLSIVPMDQIYVKANYRETQLAHVRPGQTVAITVDALPGAVFEGVVESLGPASGVTFAPVAPQNATGNFTKVVQRLPVKIQLKKGQSRLEELRVGMSVSPEIATD